MEGPASACVPLGDRGGAETQSGKLARECLQGCAKITLRSRDMGDEGPIHSVRCGGSRQ